jgi:hypothetical protein
MDSTEKWQNEAIDLIKESERFITETEIALFIKDRLRENECFRTSSGYYLGFMEAMENILEFIQKLPEQRKKTDNLTSQRFDGFSVGV